MAFKSKVSENIGISSSATQISPTVAASTTLTCIGLSIANTSANTITVSLKLTKSDASTGFIIKNAEILTGSTLVAVGGDQKLVLEAGDTIAAWSSSANTADVIISYLV